MKKSRLVLLLSSILLASCSNIRFNTGSNSSASSSSSSSTTSSVLKESATSSSLSSIADSSVSSSKEESSKIDSGSQETSSVVSTPKEGDIQIYALNDFHGACVPMDYEAGILKVGSFFKEKGKQANTLILNSGDMFQGSLLSNSNRGEFLTKVMNDVQFDCFTLGNHEFDWGVDVIKKNALLKDETTNYSTPVLAANIYNYDLETKTVGSYANLGEKYVIRTLENGIKVGIIGCIGTNQITSITSTYVDDLIFLDPVEVTKTLSDELRTKEGCDVVILDLHADEDSVLSQGLTTTSSVSHKRYVDAVLCAHSHQGETSIENGVPFVQASCNGKAYSDISLHLSSNGNVTCNSYDYTYTSSISTSIDANLQSYYDYYSSLVDADEVIGNLSGNLTKDGNGSTKVSTFVTTAMGWACNQNGNNFSIDYSMCNTSRADIKSGVVTLEDMFKALPFDNEIYIGTVKGSDIYNEMKYNTFTRYDKSALNLNSTYTIAVIDYLATHRNAARNYDYFPSFQLVDTLKNNGESWTYRDISIDYFKSLGNISASNYSSYDAIHDKDQVFDEIQ